MQSTIDFILQARRGVTHQALLERGGEAGQDAVLTAMTENREEQQARQQNLEDRVNRLMLEIARPLNDQSQEANVAQRGLQRMQAIQEEMRETLVEKQTRLQEQQAKLHRLQQELAILKREAKNYKSETATTIYSFGREVVRKM